MLRTVLLKASGSEALARHVTTRRLPRALALRYVAGETLEDGLGVVRALAAGGRRVTLDHLGESVVEPEAARSACKAYVEALAKIGEAGLPCGVSVKPTQMGLAFAPRLCEELLGDIARAAAQAAPRSGDEPAVDTRVTLDMEGSDVTEDTVALVERLHAAGHRNVGCAVQSYLRRTMDDVRRLSAIGTSLRLCKGAYAEPAAVAFRRRREVDANYAACADWLLEHGTYPRFATHDDRLVDHVKERAAALGLDRDRFEFQMLYGVRPSLQEAIVRSGYRLRVYVPFGADWYRYFMRRLAERPANLLFFLRSLRDT